MPPAQLGLPYISFFFFFKKKWFLNHLASLYFLLQSKDEFLCFTPHQMNPVKLSIVLLLFLLLSVLSLTQWKDLFLGRNQSVLK